MSASDTWLMEILISRNIPLTEIRIEVLRALHEYEEGFYPAIIIKELKSRNMSIGQNTLAAVLKTFEARGIIRKTEGELDRIHSKSILWYKLDVK